jgi:predicted DNA-binding antitoxin AbrB/MazE fold protein
MYYAIKAKFENGCIVPLENISLDGGAYEAIVVITAPLVSASKTDEVYMPPSASSFSGQQRPPSISDRDSGGEPSLTGSAINSGLPPSPISPPSQSSGVPIRVTESTSPDNISPLYHSKKNRDNRRKDNVEICVDINKDSYQRFTQGEQVSLSFEEGGNYLNSPFVLIDGNKLYPNFFKYNEGTPVTTEKEKIFSQIFDITGKLSDFIKSCSPAILTKTSSYYSLTRKGSIILKGD